MRWRACLSSLVLSELNSRAFFLQRLLQLPVSPAGSALEQRFHLFNCLAGHRLLHSHALAYMPAAC